MATATRTGRMGETAVLLKLMEMGFDAFNLNNEIPNFKGADIMCFNPKTKKSAMIQVKATFEKNPNFYTGFYSDRTGKILDKNLEECIICPWVFVQILGDNCDKTYNYYILTREEVINLIDDSNSWYWKDGGPHNNAKKDKQQVGLPLGWITGQNKMKNDGKQYPRNIKIAKPENAWNKITELLE